MWDLDNTFLISLLHDLKAIAHTQTRHLGMCYSNATSEPCLSVPCQKAWGGVQGVQAGLMGSIKVVGNYFVGDMAFCILIISVLEISAHFLLPLFCNISL